MIGTALLTAPAQAGSGPWTLNAGEQNLYIGADFYRFDRIARGPGDTEDFPVGVSAGSLTGVWTLGMATNVEAEFRGSFEGVRATRPGSDFCSEGDIPKDWCKPTSNVGDLAATVKWRILDELYFSPVSISISAAVRSGETYANTRRRLTTLGDGTTDAGAILSIGRTATLGRGWYQVSGAVAYWYRFPNIRASLSETGKVPADDLEFELEALVSPHPTFGFGPVVAGYQRLGGIDLADTTDFLDDDVWNRLRGRQIKVGAKVGIFSSDGGPTVSLAVLRTVHAVNNPADTLAISVGVGWFLPAKPSPAVTAPVPDPQPMTPELEQHPDDQHDEAQ